jgi:hypothetical protein
MLCLGQRVRMRPVGWPQEFRRRGMRVHRAVCQLMGAGGGDEAAAVEC